MCLHTFNTTKWKPGSIQKSNKGLVTSKKENKLWCVLKIHTLPFAHDASHLMNLFTMESKQALAACFDANGGHAQNACAKLMFALSRKCVSSPSNLHNACDSERKMQNASRSEFKRDACLICRSNFPVCVFAQRITARTRMHSSARATAQRDFRA